MRVFVTGASGWIGSAVTDDLLAAGYQVSGMARSEASAAALHSKGVTVRRGDLDDLTGIQAGAAAADAVIHLANKHDFSNPAVSNAAERAAVQAIGDTLAGTDRPFLFASGVAALAQGRPATEDDPSPFHGPNSPRGGGRTWHSSSWTAGCGQSACASRPPCTAVATTASSPFSPRSHAKRACPATPAKGRTDGLPCTVPTPPGW